VKKQTNLTDPKESSRTVLDDDDDFDLQLDDDIQDFDNFDDEEDDF
jgi:succinylglutamate desuccinylase